MEERINKMKGYLLLVLALVAISSNSFAQEKRNDKEKRKQWRSMELGEWKFQPGEFYILLHQSYSGAWYDGIFPFGKVKYSEAKSDTKQIMPVRTAEELLQSSRLDDVKEEEEYVKDLHDEELIREADRTIDLMYMQYKDDFNNMQDQIEDGLTYCMKKSSGKLSSVVDDMTQENEIICDAIAYIHKTGLGYELENSKRQEAYLELKDKMETLVKRVSRLVFYADTHY